jgi:hypothetical protein
VQGVRECMDRRDEEIECEAPVAKNWELLVCKLRAGQMGANL